MMSSVGKKRRERIRNKKQNQPAGGEVALRPTKRAQPEGHVKAAPGKAARRLRRQQKISKDSFVETVVTDTQPERPPRLTLRRRRSERHLEKLRREGIDPRRPEERVRAQGMVIPFSWRWLSGTLSILLVLILYGMVASDVFIVRSVSVGGERYMSREEVFELAGIANTHLFWINPREVEARIEENPSIADAQVFIGWPPNMVAIYIVERDPAIIWEQANFRVWVDVNGTVMFARRDRPDLVRIVYPDGEGVLGAGATIDREIVAAALQLKTKFPTIDVLLYDDIKGLGYRDTRQGNSWIVWFGKGTNIDMKVRVYNEIVRANYPTIIFREVNVSNADYPTFTKLYPDQ
jgi:cell division septal protein FtsQ